MKKASICAGLLMMITASATFSQTIEYFYGEITAVNAGYYRNDGSIYCAVQVGANELGSDITSSHYQRFPILLVKTSNAEAKEIYTLLLAAQLNGQKVHMRTSNQNIYLGYYFNELLEVSVGEKWAGWMY
jgi:hypothetical protein